MRIAPDTPDGLQTAGGLWQLVSRLGIMCVLALLLLYSSAMDVRLVQAEPGLRNDLHVTAAPIPAPFARFLSIAPGVASQVFWIAPYSTLRKVVRNKSTEGLPPLPYFSMMVNGFLWLMYGVCADMDPSIMLPNLTGMVAGMYWSWLFRRHDSGQFDTDRYQRSAAMIMGTIAVAVASLPAATARSVLGWAGCIVCVVMFSGPLQVISSVIAARSTRNLPFPMAVATVVNCVLWLMYGSLVTHDPFVWAPNVLGLTSGLVQLALFARYGIALPVVDSAGQEQDSQ